MTRLMLTYAAAVAVLGVFAHAPEADAGSFKRNGAKASYSNQFKAVKRSARTGVQGAGKLSSARRPQAFPGHAAAIHALSLYYRKCLDNIFPECPK